ncbi:MAG: hypothetical protein QOI00_2331, partial [Chloroflexota bacterium]|nr:hypothetical protein [Chloroflexota bacterium]
ECDDVGRAKATLREALGKGAGRRSVHLPDGKSSFLSVLLRLHGPGAHRARWPWLEAYERHDRSRYSLNCCRTGSTISSASHWTGRSESAAIGARTMWLTPASMNSTMSSRVVAASAI